MPKIVLMVFKRAVMYAMAGAPFVLLAMIGAESRFGTSDWKFIEYGPTTSQRIYAYSKPVVMAQKKGRSAASVEAAADYWIGAAESGVLKDVPPATLVLDSSTTVYTQIQSAKGGLIDSLFVLATELESKADRARALEVYVKVLKLSEIAKYSEFNSFSAAVVKQSRALKRVMAIAPQLSPQERAVAVRAIDELSRDQKGIEVAFNHVASAYRNDAVRTGGPTADVVLIQDRARLASADDTFETRYERWTKMTSANPKLFPLYGKARTALTQQRQMASLLALARTSLTSQLLS